MRLTKANQELTFENKFDTVVVNDNLNEAQHEAYGIVKEFLREKDC